MVFKISENLMLAFMFDIVFLKNIINFLKALEVLKNASQVEDLQNYYTTYQYVPRCRTAKKYNVPKICD